MKTHTYLKSDEEREQGGTPNIIGCIRAGLSVQLHHDIGSEKIKYLDGLIVSNFIESLKSNDNIIIHGHGKTTVRAPYFSLSIKNLVSSYTTTMFRLYCPTFLVFNPAVDVCALDRTLKVFWV